MLRSLNCYNLMVNLCFEMLEIVLIFLLNLSCLISSMESEQRRIVSSKMKLNQFLKKWMLKLAAVQLKIMGLLWIEYSRLMLKTRQESELRKVISLQSQKILVYLMILILKKQMSQWKWALQRTVLLVYQWTMNQEYQMIRLDFLLMSKNLLMQIMLKSQAVLLKLVSHTKMFQVKMIVTEWKSIIEWIQAKVQRLAGKWMWVMKLK